VSLPPGEGDIAWDYARRKRTGSPNVRDNRQTMVCLGHKKVEIKDEGGVQAIDYDGTQACYQWQKGDFGQDTKLVS